MTEDEKANASDEDVMIAFMGDFNSGDNNPETYQMVEQAFCCECGFECQGDCTCSALLEAARKVETVASEFSKSDEDASESVQSDANITSSAEDSASAQSEIKRLKFRLALLETRQKRATQGPPPKKPPAKSGSEDFLNKIQGIPGTGSNSCVTCKKRLLTDMAPMTEGEKANATDEDVMMAFMGDFTSEDNNA